MWTQNCGPHAKPGVCRDLRTPWGELLTLGTPCGTPSAAEHAGYLERPIPQVTAKLGLNPGQAPNPNGSAPQTPGARHLPSHPPPLGLSPRPRREGAAEPRRTKQRAGAPSPPNAPAGPQEPPRLHVVAGASPHPHPRGHRGCRSQDRRTAPPGAAWEQGGAHTRRVKSPAHPSHGLAPLAPGTLATTHPCFHPLPPCLSCEHQPPCGAQGVPPAPSSSHLPRTHSCSFRNPRCPSEDPPACLAAAGQDHTRFSAGRLNPQGTAGWGPPCPVPGSFRTAPQQKHRLGPRCQGHTASSRR